MRDEVFSKRGHGPKIVGFVIVGAMFLQGVIGEMDVIIVKWSCVESIGCGSES